jgi:uncharacterized protein
MALPINRPAKQEKASRKPAAPFQCRLLVMAKVPELGRVKTRLARQVGGVEAVRFYRHTLAAVLGRVGSDPRWSTSLSVAPDTGITHRVWPRTNRRHMQGAGDLGQRMQRIMQCQPPGPVIIIGTDIPAVQPADIANAFKRLRRAEVVFGAAPDGGYWLVGLRRSPRILRPFRDVRWSSPATLDDTIANLNGHAVERAATLSDVDSAEDLATCRGWYGRRILPTQTRYSVDDIGSLQTIVSE